MNSTFCTIEDIEASRDLFATAEQLVSASRRLVLDENGLNKVVEDSTLEF